MDFRLSEEQELLRASVGDYLGKNYSHQQRLAGLHRGDVMLPGIWKDCAELGWLSMMFGEQDGGLGLGPIELMLVCEEFGRHLVLEPFLETVVLAGGLLRRAGSPQQKASYLGRLMAGDLQAAFAYLEPHHTGWIGEIKTRLDARNGQWLLTGRKCVVYNAPQAELIIVLARSRSEYDGIDGTSVVLVPSDAHGVARRDYRTLDGHSAADIEFNDVVLSDAAILARPGQAQGLIEAVLDEARLASAAEAFGAMQALLDMTVEYTKQRKQFGVSISQFQVLQHKMADMYIAIELTRSLLYAAAIKQHERAEDAPLFTAALKAKADQAARVIVHNAIQLHGAIATTHELSVGHYLKRLIVLAQMFGNPRHHAAQFLSLKNYHEVHP